MKVRKWLGIAAAALAVVLVAAAAAIYAGSNAKLRRTYLVDVRPVARLSDAAALARGKHLAATRGCFECHGEDLGGRTVIDDPAMGRIAGPNLTRGKGGLPATFGERDLVRAIRHGVAPDGRGYFLMPSTDFMTFSDPDLGALVAYVQSVPPVDRPRVPVALGPVARTLVALGKIKLAAEEIDHAGVKPAVVAPGVSVEYGQYVAAACTGCHGPNLAGGRIAAGPPDWPPAANLTPGDGGRIKGWTEADFFRAIRTARRPDGTEVSPVMPRAFGGLDDLELMAVWRYLQTLPPVATGAR